MLNLIKADFYKLARLKSFYVCALVAIAFAVLGVVSIKLVAEVMPQEYQQTVTDAAGEEGNVNVRVGSTGLEAFEDPFNPTAYEMYFGSFGSGETVPIFICIFAAIFITSEFANGTYKITLAKGRGRIKAYLSKLIGVSFASAVYVLLYQLTTIALSVALFSWGRAIGGAEIGAMLAFLGLMLLVHIAVAALMTMLAMLLRSNAATIAIGITGLILLGLLFQVINLLVGGDFDIARYWLLNAVPSLAVTNPATKEIIRALILSVVYFGGTTAIGMAAFNRRDIK